jgi:transcriptional regulator of acetoin/glycerol metabolism
VTLNIRVIAATHRDLVDLVKAGQFREDLYFRLNGAVLALPPLRQRSDLERLIEQRLLKLTAANGTAYALSATPRTAMLAYDWPGNIRELMNAIDYGCALSTGGVIDVGDLPERITHSQLAMKSPSKIGKRTTASAATADQAEALLTALRDNRWNISRVARAQGVDRSTIHRQIHRFGITTPKDLVGAELRCLRHARA